MKSILIQLDTDPQPSTFDRVVAIDAGVDQLFSYGGVTPENVAPLVHGAMFTRGSGDLKHTALFIGGSDVPAGEAVLKTVEAAFFGPVRVSVMLDSSGSNTTAAAAVLAAGRHLDLAGCEALVLGGTGPVGQRATELLTREGAAVRVGSRSRDRAEAVCNRLRESIDGARVTACATASSQDLAAAAHGAALLIAAGAAGVELAGEDQWRSFAALQVAIDLNAVPPAGLGGIVVTDKAADRGGVICYGAIGVGGTKMKIHKAAVRALFETSDRVLDTAAIYELGRGLAD